MSGSLAWLRSKNITSHSVAVAVISAATLIMGDESVRDWVLASFSAHPKIGTAIISAAGIILKYSHSSSPAGTMAQARQVMSEPDAPTAKQVDAATPPKGA